MKTHVVIATTEGHAYVQRITPEEVGVQSVVCLDGTAQVLPVSAAYHAFVRRGSGVIARDFGHDAFRTDIGARVDQGTSWQLPLYLAHALHAIGDLGDGVPKQGDRVLWATGEVDVDLVVRRVDGVAQKLKHAIAPVRALRARGVDVQLLLPSDNVGESAGYRHDLAGISGVTRLKDVLPKPKSPAPVAAPAQLQPPRTRPWRWLVITLVVAALLLAMGHGLKSVFFPSGPDNGNDLDDFGGRGRDLMISEKAG